MILDEIDINILKIFDSLKKDEFTGTKLITKYLFPNATKGMLRAKERTINYRIRRMSPDLIKVSKNGKGNYEYTFREENVIFKKHKFPNGMKKALFVRIDSKWNVFES